MAARIKDLADFEEFKDALVKGEVADTEAESL